jgi:hypothetical protein
LEVTKRRRGGKATVVTLYAPGVGVVQREETFPIIEGSGSFYPQRQDEAVMRLREWKLSATVSMCLLSWRDGYSLGAPTALVSTVVAEEGQTNCRP